MTTKMSKHLSANKKECFRFVKNLDTGITSLSGRRDKYLH